jgi:uncharacterized membrane protein YcjF (UPF0283 family)
MSDCEEVLAILKRIEQNQLKALQIQSEQLAQSKAQIEKTEARVQESIELQKTAVSRQAKALNVVVPILLLAMLYVAYLLFRHS